VKEAQIRPQALFDRYLELSRQDIERLFRDTSGFVQVVCPACGAAEQRPGLQKYGFSYVSCGACASLYVSPRPTVEQLHRFYQEGEAVKFWSSAFYRETEEARREKLFRPRAQLAAELADRYGMSPKASLVDVGAGYGLFLEEVLRVGRFGMVIGIEPNPDLGAVCRKRGFRVVAKPVEHVDESEVRGDIATAFEVLEHVFDPLRFLTAMRGLVRPNGLIVFTTLTVSGFDIQVLWERSKSVYPPHHINLISVEGMDALVRRAGLSLVELSTPGLLDVDIVANMALENPDLSLPRFVTYLLGSRDQRCRDEFQSFLSGNRLSSHIRVVARRPGASRK
jgi:2-polyprenyl-3-methyl-5-hydroxy-6-metoxy-1,4-benzoquinol methylase